MAHVAVKSPRKIAAQYAREMWIGDPPTLRRRLFRNRWRAYKPPLRWHPSALNYARRGPRPWSALRGLDARQRFRLAAIIGASAACSSTQSGAVYSNLKKDLEMPHKLHVVHSNPDILSGTPVFVGTRVPVQSLFDHLESGDTLDRFLGQFPSVTRQQAIAVLELARDALLANLRQV